MPQRASVQSAGDGVVQSSAIAPATAKRGIENIVLSLPILQGVGHGSVDDRWLPTVFVSAEFRNDNYLLICGGLL